MGRVFSSHNFFDQLLSDFTSWPCQPRIQQILLVEASGTLQPAAGESNSTTTQRKGKRSGKIFPAQSWLCSPADCRGYRSLDGQPVNITPAGVPTQRLSNERVPNESRLLVLARHRAQLHKPKSASSEGITRLVLWRPRNTW